MAEQLTVDNLCGAIRKLFALTAAGAGPPPGCNVLRLQGVPDAEAALLLDACGGALYIEIRAQLPVDAPRPACSPHAAPVKPPPGSGSPLVVTGPLTTVEDQTG